MIIGMTVGVAVLAGCGSSGSDATPGTTDSTVERNTTTITADSSPATTSGSSDTTMSSGSTEDAPEIFGTEIPVPEGSTFKKDGFAIGSDGPRQAEFTFSSGSTADALNDYKSTLEADGFTITREQPGRAYVAKKGDLELQMTSRNDLYDDGVVILTFIYDTGAS